MTTLLPISRNGTISATTASRPSRASEAVDLVLASGRRRRVVKRVLGALTLAALIVAAPSAALVADGRATGGAGLGLALLTLVACHAVGRAADRRFLHDVVVAAESLSRDEVTA